MLGVDHDEHADRVEHGVYGVGDLVVSRSCTWSRRASRREVIALGMDVTRLTRKVVDTNRQSVEVAPAAMS